MSDGMTELAFHGFTDVAEQAIEFLGSIVTAPYERIRVLALGPQGADGNVAGEVEVTLSLVQEQGTPGPLDRVLIGANSSFTRVYDIPGVMLAVSARAPSAASSVDVYIWGRRSAADGLAFDTGASGAGRAATSDDDAPTPPA